MEEMIKQTWERGLNLKLSEAPRRDGERRFEKDKPALSNRREEAARNRKWSAINN